MNAIVFHPIGAIHTPHTDPAGMPIQPRGAIGVQGRIEIPPEFAEGLRDLGGFSHVHLLCPLHVSRGVSLRLVPFIDDVPRGVFVTRAPRRPNAIGTSVVRLREARGPVFLVENVDMLEGTPPQAEPRAPSYPILVGALRQVPETQNRDPRGSRFEWLRGQDLNLRPSGYEPDELPDCSTPRQGGLGRQRPLWGAEWRVKGGAVAASRPVSPPVASIRPPPSAAPSPRGDPPVQPGPARRRRLVGGAGPRDR